MAEAREEMAADAQPDSGDDARLERWTWLGVVGVLVVTGALPDTLAPHTGLTPLAASLILLLAGGLRLRRGLRARRSHWIAGAVLLAVAGVNFLSRPDLDLSLLVVVIAALVIGAGILTREP